MLIWVKCYLRYAVPKGMKRILNKERKINEGREEIDAIYTFASECVPTNLYSDTPWFTIDRSSTAKWKLKIM